MARIPTFVWILAGIALVLVIFLLLGHQIRIS